MLFSTSNTGPVLEHMANSSSHLSSLLDKHFPICLTKAQTFQGLPHHTLGLNQTVYQIPFVVCFSTNCPKPDPGATDFSWSYLGVLPCFDSHFVEIASHDSVILPNKQRIFHANGTQICIECKGYSQSTWK